MNEVILVGWILLGIYIPDCLQPGDSCKGEETPIVVQGCNTNDGNLLVRCSQNEKEVKCPYLYYLGLRGGMIPQCPSEPK